MQELGLRRLEEELKLKEIELRGEKARYLARKERDEREAAKREAELAKECAEREKAQRKDVEGCAAREVKEKLMLEKALDSNGEQYTRYTWEEIQLATSSFSSAFMIGRGANGTVYKGSFHHTIAAVKILHSNEGHGTKQLKQEVWMIQTKDLHEKKKKKPLFLHLQKWNFYLFSLFSLIVNFIERNCPPGICTQCKVDD